MGEDAKKVSEILGLKLRVEGDAENPVFFCGFPESGLDKYIGKLVRAGFSAAVYRQRKSETDEIKREISETIKGNRCLFLRGVAHFFFIAKQSLRTQGCGYKAELRSAATIQVFKSLCPPLLKGDEEGFFYNYWGYNANFVVKL